MKKITQILATACIAVFLFTFGIANAQTINYDDPAHPNKATSISGFVLNGITYDVAFTGSEKAVDIYGAFPGVYTFNTTADSFDAVTAINVLFTAEDVLKVGVVGGGELQTFYIPYEGYINTGGGEGIRYWYGTRPGPNWFSMDDFGFYNADLRNWAVFTTDLGTNDALFGASISVYPNPADNYINLETKEYIQSIYIYDVTGKVMQHLNFEMGEATTLDVSKFNAGMYFLKLQDDKGHMTVKRIIIQ